MDTPTRPCRSPSIPSVSRCRPDLPGACADVASSSAATPVPAADPASLPVLRVMHRLPGRIRLRIEGIEWTPQRAEQLVGRVALVPGVASSRFAIHCASLTVVHVVAHEAVMAEVRQILLQIKVSASDVPVRPPATRSYLASTRARAAARRLVVCAVIGLVIALMPDPVAPAMILLRMVLSLVCMAVERQALAVTERPPVARLLGMLAFLASVARADHVARALAEAVLGVVLGRPCKASPPHMNTGRRGRSRMAGTLESRQPWRPGEGLAVPVCCSPA